MQHMGMTSPYFAKEGQADMKLGGLQDAVTSAGPLLALIGFVVLPFVWSLPEALVTAELATAFPEDSG